MTIFQRDVVDSPDESQRPKPEPVDPSTGGHERRHILPQLPKDVQIDDTGNGVRVRIISRGRDSMPRNGSIRYDTHWVAQCDTSSDTGLKAAVDRSIIVDSLVEPDGPEGALAEKFITDPKYQIGWFFVTGVNERGDRSAPSPPKQIGGGILDTSVPPNVEHLSVSESGEVHDKVTYSALAFSMRTPKPKAGFDAVQPVLKDYPNRGNMTALTEKAYQGLAGGVMSFKLLVQPARRPGTGTVTASSSSPIITFGGAENAILQAQAGDLLEILGVRGTILSVDSALQVTLTANWSGADVVALSTYCFLGKIGIYMRSVSAGGGYDPDFANLPYVEVVLDAELSAPNPPVLDAVSAGNIIRCSVTLPEGTEIDHAVLYRGTGDGVAFSACSPIKTWPADGIQQTTTLQYEDTDFTAYEKETAQVFTYYAVAVNVRGMQSDPSLAATAECRLNSGKEGSDPLGKLGMKNLIYNGFIGGTTFNEVLASDVSQDYWFDSDASNLPGVPFGCAAAQSYGTGRFKGYTRWNSDDAGTGAAGQCYFNNGTEVGFEPPGVGMSRHLWQEIEAWDSIADIAPAGYRFMRIKRGGVYTLAWKMRQGGGTAPDGYLLVILEQYASDVSSGKCERRYRDSSDALLWTTNDYTISGADLLTDWQLYYTTFRLRTDLVGDTQQLRVRFAWFDGTQGEIFVTEVMLCEGEEFGAFSGDLQETSWPPANGSPPRDLGDGDGRRRDKIPVAA